jgi:DNA-directed RNA polymerase subunit A'
MSSEEGYYKQIDGLTFKVLSPQEIRKLAVVEIQTADTYDEDGAPITSGLMDGRLGTLEPRQRCKTCGNTAAKCPGHFGYIELSAPVAHVAFAKKTHDLLSSTCRDCGRILLSEERVKELLQKAEEEKQIMGFIKDGFYVEIVKEAKKSSQCSYCGARQYKIEFSKPTTFHEIVEEGGAMRLTPAIIRERLERISIKDLVLLGIEPNAARPEWMILQVLPVPPVYVRPSITLESGIRSEDDLTHKLVDIIRINQRLRENIDAGAPTLIIQDLSELLQYHVTTYFDNEASGIPPARHRSGRALKTLSQRLKGKEGRFRSNLSGKRVDFSARTVISPDPNIDVNDVGVPLDIAMRLTVPERVAPWNMEEMKRFILNGPENYPGALYILRPDGKRIRLEFVSERDKLAETLQYGFVVERHLKDGDIAVFNRQPSLHRMSIMAHRVRVLPYKTFRLHLSVCPPYNADFDGDEMNLHVPQSEEAQAEARLLMLVQDQILSPRYGGPIIGAIRDFLSSSFILTSDKTLLPKEVVCNLLTAAEYEGDLPEPITTDPQPLWTGKQIFSCFLPKGFNYVQKSDVSTLIVRNGILEQGLIDKNAIGAEKSDSIYHRIVKDYGAEDARKFLYSICRLATAFITMRGFSYSLGELDLSKEARKKIDKVIATSELNVQGLVEKYKEGTLQRLPGKSLDEALEIFIMNELASTRDKSGDVADRYFTIDNNGVIMTRSGARGSSLNIGQMTACIGQQAVRGKRILRGYRDRALSYFKPGDPSPRARGFVYNSYRDGLNPIEFFFHSMGGREGLVDTAVRTQQSGYMQRRLINALEHLKAEYDGTVRDSKGSVIQLKYGEDGVDPAKSDHGKAANVDRLIDVYKIDAKEGRPADEKYITNKLDTYKDRMPPSLIFELEKKLAESGFGEKTINDIVELAADNYLKALVEPGEAVGVVAAQSIGEPGTQMTLRTFHYAGVKERNVTLGLPRLIEIVDARRNPSTPVMTISLDKKHQVSKEKATEVAQRIIYTTVEDVAKKVFIDPKEVAVTIDLDEAMLLDRGLTATEVTETIKIPDCESSQNENVITIKPKTPQNLGKLYNKVFSLHLRGIPGIRRALVVEEKGRWIIYTDGSNLSKVMKVPGVDPSNILSNNIHEIAETLGIEAARNVIIKEAMNVLEEQGLDVDIRHVMLVADVMTSTGEVHQIGRHGVSGEKASVLARAAFEITVPSLIEAALRGQSDMLKGVTENVIVGQSVPVGTGLVDLYMTSLAPKEASNKGEN